MPIVDGKASTKMIRAYEQTNPSLKLSARARLNGRVPIIAVSASLLEKERQSYIDIGFDGWILKPISFPRINELMLGIVDQKTREEALYQPGQWEKGGWFHRAQPQVGTKSMASGKALAGEQSEPTKTDIAAGASNVGSSQKETASDEQSRANEGERQGEGAEGRTDSNISSVPNSASAPELGRTASDDSQAFHTPLSTPLVPPREPES